MAHLPPPGDGNAAEDVGVSQEQESRKKARHDLFQNPPPPPYVLQQRHAQPPPPGQQSQPAPPQQAPPTATVFAPNSLQVFPPLRPQPLQSIAYQRNRWLVPPPPPPPPLQSIAYQRNPWLVPPTPLPYVLLDPSAPLPPQPRTPTPIPSGFLHNSFAAPPARQPAPHPPPPPPPPPTEHQIEGMGEIPENLQPPLHQLHRLCRKQLSNSDMKHYLKITGHNRAFLRHTAEQANVRFPVQVNVVVIGGPPPAKYVLRKYREEEFVLAWNKLVNTEGFELIEQQPVDMWFEIVPEADPPSMNIYIRGDKPLKDVLHV